MNYIVSTFQRQLNNPQVTTGNSCGKFLLELCIEVFGPECRMRMKTLGNVGPVLDLGSFKNFLTALYPHRKLNGLGGMMRKLDIPCQRLISLPVAVGIQVER